MFFVLYHAHTRMYCIVYQVELNNSRKSSNGKFFFVFLKFFFHSSLFMYFINTISQILGNTHWSLFTANSYANELKITSYIWKIITFLSRKKKLSPCSQKKSKSCKFDLFLVVLHICCTLVFHMSCLSLLLHDGHSL